MHLVMDSPFLKIFVIKMLWFYYRYFLIAFCKSMIEFPRNFNLIMILSWLIKRKMDDAQRSEKLLYAIDDIIRKIN